MLVVDSKIWDSIDDPRRFKNVKVERYADGISNRKYSGKEQVEDKSVNGYYAQDFKRLVKFIDTAEYVIVEKRDSSYLEYESTNGIDMLREVQIVDTEGFVSVEESLFGEYAQYITMRKDHVKRIDTRVLIQVDIMEKKK